MISVLSVFIAVALALFLDKSRTIRIADAKKKATITLTAPPKARNIHGISLRIYGNIKGSGTIRIGDNPAVSISNSFDVSHKGDWYTATCEVHYTPIGVENGSFAIEYEFLD